MEQAPGDSRQKDIDIERLETSLGYRFGDSGVLLTALTHRSYVNEREGERLRHNEALEFLGDAVLGFLVSAHIFRLYPNLTEGELSKMKAYLVSAAGLVRMAEAIRLGDYLLLSRGEDKTGGRGKRAILVDAYEAVVGAIYIDGGVEAAAAFVDKQLVPALEAMDLLQLTCGDFKSALQEKLHVIGLPEPDYRVVDTVGPDHRKIFVVSLSVRGKVVAKGEGRTKKEAQQAAAREALADWKSWAPELEAGRPAEDASGFEIGGPSAAG
jgi:ribonuclease III